MLLKFRHPSLSSVIFEVAWSRKREWCAISCNQKIFARLWLHVSLIFTSLSLVSTNKEGHDPLSLVSKLPCWIALTCHRPHSSLHFPGEWSAWRVRGGCGVPPCGPPCWLWQWVSWFSLRRLPLSPPYLHRHRHSWEHALGTTTWGFLWTMFLEKCCVFPEAWWEGPSLIPPCRPFLPPSWWPALPSGFSFCACGMVREAETLVVGIFLVNSVFNGFAKSSGHLLLLFRILSLLLFSLLFPFGGTGLSSLMRSHWSYPSTNSHVGFTYWIVTNSSNPSMFRIWTSLRFFW